MNIGPIHTLLPLCVVLLTARCQVGGNGVVLEEEPLPPVEQSEQEANEAELPDGEIDEANNSNGARTRNGIMRRLENEGVFEDWDTNGDGLLDPREFSTNMFELWDTDDDGVLSRTEWEQNQTRWFDDTYKFRDWDSDGDGHITREEFETGVRENNVLDAWNGISEER